MSFHLVGCVLAGWPSASRIDCEEKSTTASYRTHTDKAAWRSLPPHVAHDTAAGLHVATVRGVRPTPDPEPAEAEPAGQEARHPDPHVPDSSAPLPCGVHCA